MNQKMLKLAIGALLICGCSATGSKSPNGSRDGITSDNQNRETDLCRTGKMPWGDTGICVSLIDNCPAPWEMPGVGGGCVNIGPRACPKLWNPELDDDCDPAELMECPEGFVLTADEVACIPFFADNCIKNEIELLGGDCMEVGPSWYDLDKSYGGLEVPVFDECSSGQLALLGGGCAQAGPLACPALWDPDAEVDCVVAEVLPCPDGWKMQAGGLYCDPAYGSCQPGERALPEGKCQRVVPLPEDCPPGPFSELTVEADTVIHVLAGGSDEQSCGSAVEPCASLQFAVANVADNGQILIGPGTYDEGVDITRPINIAGLCASQVFITGTVSLEQLPTSLSSTGILIRETQDVSISGVTVSSPSSGIIVYKSKSVVLSDCEVADSIGIGVMVQPASEATLQNVWVHDMNIDPSTSVPTGMGLVINHDSTVLASEVLVESTIRSGIETTGKDAVFKLENGGIRGVKALTDGNYGNGVTGDGKSILTLTDVLVEHHQGFGLLAVDGAILDSDRVVVRSPDLDGLKNGIGMLVLKGCKAFVKNSLFMSNRGVGILATGDGCEVTVTGSVITETTIAKDGTLGLGVFLDAGANASIAGSIIARSAENAIYVAKEGTTLELKGTMIGGVGEASDNGSFAGLLVEYGGAAQVFHTLFQGNEQYAVRVQGEDTGVSVSDSTIRASVKGIGNGDAQGVVVAKKGEATITHCLLEENARVGLAAYHPLARLTVENSVIRSTITDLAGWGMAILVDAGAEATVTGCHLYQNTEQAISSGQTGSRVHVTNSVIEHTRPDVDGRMGVGMVVHSGAEGTIADSLFIENTTAGVIVDNLESQLEMTGSVVRDGKMYVGDFGGDGLIVLGGAQATVEDCLLDNNFSSGLWVDGAGSFATVNRSIIRLAKSVPQHYWGDGISLSHGAAATVLQSLVEACEEAGVILQDNDSHLDMTGTVIRGTFDDSDSYQEYAFAVIEGASAHVSASLMDRNYAGGMYVRGLDTTLSMIDSVIRKTSLDEDGLEGHGMKIHGNAAATLERCLLEDNHSFGITFSAPDTDLYVIASVIRKTRPNAGDLYGFGLLGFHSKVTLSGVLVSENQEVGLQANYEPTEIVISGSIIRNTQTRDHGAAGAGVLAVTGAQITLHQTLVSGNATFGIGADGPGAKMVLSRSTVSDTEHGGLSRVINGQIEEQVFGDGAIATQGGFLMVTESAVLRNGRTGIFVTNSSAELSDSVILDNYSYGLAMKDSEQAVSYKELGNYITGNASGLPANLASDISTDPGGMPVPNEPAMPEFSKWDR